MFSRHAGLSYEWRGGPTVSRGAERDTFSVMGERERERDASDTDGWTPPSSTLLEHEICDTEWKADLFQWSGGGKRWICDLEMYMRSSSEAVVGLEHAGQYWCLSEESWQEENSCGGTWLQLHTCHRILPAFLPLLLSRCCSFNLYPLRRVNPEASNAVRFMSVNLMMLLLLYIFVQLNPNCFILINFTVSQVFDLLSFLINVFINKFFIFNNSLLLFLL